MIVLIGIGLAAALIAVIGYAAAVAAGRSDR